MTNNKTKPQVKTIDLNDYHKVRCPVCARTDETGGDVCAYCGADLTEERELLESLLKRIELKVEL